MDADSERTAPRGPRRTEPERPTIRREASTHALAAPATEAPEATALVRKVAFAPLSPLAFLRRSASVWRDRDAIIDGERIWTYREHAERVHRLANALRNDVAVGSGDRIAALLPNTAAMLEVHYAVPSAGGVLVPLNTRLTAHDYAYILEHSGARVLIADEAFRETVEHALSLLEHSPSIIWVAQSDPGRCQYEGILQSGTLAPLPLLDDEERLLSINYTSGTTGRPKGVMTNHRGAYLHTLGVIADAGLTPTSGYLWTLPMFHCNGWAYTWAVTAAGARHVCLPDLSGEKVWDALHRHTITHLCAAPTVMTMLLDAPEARRSKTPVSVFVGGSPPAPSLISRAERYNLAVTHLYGMTETYGPIAICAWNPDWNVLPEELQAKLRARQGVATIVSEQLRVVDGRMQDVSADGETVGELVMRGNNVMVGYYGDPQATAEAFRGGWLHSGDLGVMHPDGYVELRDRLKDVVISGGENISTIEVEQVLTSHPAISEAAVVAAPNDLWGEVPVAFVTVAAGALLDEAELLRYLRDHLAHFKVPKRIQAVDALPKTATGKIQKFVLRAALERGEGRRAAV